MHVLLILLIAIHYEILRTWPEPDPTTFTAHSTGESKRQTMDESWRRRIHIRMPTTPPENRHYPPRRSVKDYTSRRRNPTSGGNNDDVLTPGDFADVFGGPPSTILSRQFSDGCSRSSSSPGFFYEEIFRPPEKAIPARSGRSLPEFRIPGQKADGDKNRHGGFYDDIFGWEHRTVESSRSKSRSKTSSSLSSEDLSPLRPAIYGDYEDEFGVYASKLRPIHVKSSWNSRKMLPKNHRRPQNAIPTTPTYPDEKEFRFVSTPKPTSPETISLKPISNSSFRVSADDLKLHSPSSSVSSVCHSSDREQKDRVLEEVILRQDNPMEQEEEYDDDDDDDDVVSSYVIEINSDNRNGICESNGVDEAIAWAKEKFRTQSEEDSNKQDVQECETEKHTESSAVLKEYQAAEGNSDSFGSWGGQREKWDAEEETQQQETLAHGEMQMLDEKISVWSSGKEIDILLLLSSLHQILWPNSGWVATPLSNMIESSQLKKAYQKACLCLHPDKLQQRGATLTQKYIAEKAFSILQDAWSTFISRGIL